MSSLGNNQSWLFTGLSDSNVLSRSLTIWRWWEYGYASDLHAVDLMGQFDRKEVIDLAKPTKKSVQDIEPAGLPSGQLVHKVAQISLLCLVHTTCEARLLFLSPVRRTVPPSMQSH